MIKEYEPLRMMCGHFLECIRSGGEPRSSGEVGRRVTAVLAAAHMSLKQGYRRVGVEEVASWGEKC
jgi:UDP-2-acetamido-3-amino-2,3-dideoxy-glucuronate N-acetyltransferase